MKMPDISLLEWQKKFGNEGSCAAITIEVAQRMPGACSCENC